MRRWLRSRTSSVPGRLGTTSQSACVALAVGWPAESSQRQRAHSRSACRSVESTEKNQAVAHHYQRGRISFADHERPFD